MAFACVVWLHPQFVVRPGFWAYPAMMACYVSAKNVIKYYTNLNQ